MIVLESEANLQICPLLQGTQYKDYVGSGATVEHARCFGAKCMFWRWYEPLDPTDRRGRCGIAGSSEPVFVPA